MQVRLYTGFRETREKGQGVSYGCMLRRAQKIYRKVHSERCTRLKSGGWKYEGFKFSDGWFNGFRKRYDISDRSSMKQAQKVPKNM